MESDRRDGHERLAAGGGLDDAPNSEITRDSLLGLVGTLFEGPAHIVVLEGQEGIGKSTLLRQFALANPEQSIVLALSGASRWAYSPLQVLTDLCGQLHFLL